MDEKKIYEMLETMRINVIGIKRILRNRYNLPEWKKESLENFIGIMNDYLNQISDEINGD